jgi:acyl-CoA thioesterase
MGVTGRDVRVVDGAYTNDPEAPPGPPVLDSWVRFRDVPDDPVLHAGLLAQFTGHMSIAAALRPHDGIGQAAAHRTLSMGINAITLSLHREVHADDWMLYHHLSTFAGDGMTHSECRVHAQSGALLASFSVDAMVRPFPDGPAANRDERTAL